jgi:hypothetical protein
LSFCFLDEEDETPLLLPPQLPWSLLFMLLALLTPLPSGFGVFFKVRRRGGAA